MQDPEVAQQFAITLREAREQADISQEALAGLAGLHRTAVGQLERAETAPRLATVLRLAGALALDPSALMTPLRWTPPDPATVPKGDFVLGPPPATRNPRSSTPPAGRKALD